MQDPGRQEGRPGKEVKNAGALNALADDVMRFVRPGDVTDDIANGTNPVEVVGTGVFNFRVSL